MRSHPRCRSQRELSMSRHDGAAGHDAARRSRGRGRVFRGIGAPMNYQAFTNDSLTMMYEGIRGALAADDALRGLGEESRFRVKETPDWKKHAADLESEMLKRGMLFEVIDWDEGQTKLPFKS
jgi:hypothetical protein